MTAAKLTRFKSTLHNTIDFPSSFLATSVGGSSVWLIDRSVLKKKEFTMEEANVEVAKAMRRCFILFFCFLIIGAANIYVPAAFGQDIMTKGSIGGRILDATGAVVPDATVTVSGPTGDRTTTTNSSGDFEVTNLTPGSYSVKAEKQGFKAVSTNEVQVQVGKTASLRLTLQVGDVSQTVEVVAADSTGVDLSSTAISSNLGDQLYQNLPVGRGVQSLFYLAPGTSDGGATGAANPSIAGGSGLDNLYIADGVNVTDSAFGGLGAFSRSYGAIGTGINTSFVKETQVKTGGFEPQYGQAQGGIINIITKSGGNAWHGALYAYGQPKWFEAVRKQPDDALTNKVGKMIDNENYDGGGEIGGPVVKNKIFVFGLYNPSVRRDLVQGAQGSGLFALYGAQTHRRQLTNNYSFKVDANISEKHQFTFSLFGDPTKSNAAPWRSLNIDNTTANSVLDYGTRNTVLHYTGAWTSTWTTTASFSQGFNRFNETGFANFNQIVDRTQPTRGNFTAIGLGFVEPTTDHTYRGTFDTTKFASFWGTHTFGFGYNYQRALYNGIRDRSGPHYVVPATNADGTYKPNAKAIGQTMNAAWSLRIGAASCTLCPFMNVPGSASPVRVYLRQDRGEFGGASFDTYSRYHASYLQDTWNINRHLTVIGGVRWEIERLIGSPGATTGNRNAYSFTGQWAPRVGVTFDPSGSGKTKISYSFGRFFEYVPLDLAERSLSSEKDITGAFFAPDFTLDPAGVRRAVVNSFGTVNPVVDAAHLITKAAGGAGTGVTVSAQDATNFILPGTKLGYSEEHSIGFERDLGAGIVLTVRYQDKRMKRIIEDAAVDPADDEGGLFGQTYFIGNVNAKLDAAVNPIAHTFPADGTPPAICDPSLVNSEVVNASGTVLGGVCYETNGKNGKPAGDPGADGVPDGFVDPVHVYKALTVEVNKKFSNNWQLLSNLRIGSLRGNYEGHFRNDNFQSDPAISSLFDFTPGVYGLLGDQFAVGPLPNDRRTIANFYGSYMFTDAFGGTLRNLNFSPGIHIESGTPVSELWAHPVYLNAGEVPVGGRGKLGRTGTFAKLDLHADFPLSITESIKFKFLADFFNVTNNQAIRFYNQLKQSTFGQDNPDFHKVYGGEAGLPGSSPTGYYAPFSMRLGVRLEF